jgi:diguanylate cyclase (GGDEF)-like protein
MSKSIEILLEYVGNAFRNPSGTTLNLEGLDAEFLDLGKKLISIAHFYDQYNKLAKALSKGNLSVEVPSSENELAAPLKSLHASLKHLTWQTQQVASGDYNQRVDFMGEFSDAFNTMTEQLKDRQEKLIAEIEKTKKKALALEQSNQFFVKITQNLPQQIMIATRNKGEVVFMNESAKDAERNDPEYAKRILALLAEQGDAETGYNLGVESQGAHLSVNFYPLEWAETNAVVFVANDVSVEKKQMEVLEVRASVDVMTNLYNRASGMLKLNEWAHTKKMFALVFVDLDRLKYVNDVYGHNEGDIYIKNVAKHLQSISGHNIVARIGGDEFMLLMPGKSKNEAHSVMDTVYKSIASDEYLKDKKYEYSISFGIVAVSEDSDLSTGDMLCLADERMYENKRIRRKNRRDNLKKNAPQAELIAIKPEDIM